MFAVSGPGSKRRALSVASLLVVLAWAAVASAQEGRVGIRIIGKGDAQIRNSVGEVLATKGFKLTSHQQVEAAARSIKRGFGSNGDIAAITKKLKLTALVTGEVNGPAGKARIVVHNGANGASLADASFSVKGGADKLADVVQKTLWSKIGSGLQRAQPAGGRSGEVAARKGADRKGGGDNGKPAPSELDEEEEEEAAAAADEPASKDEPEKRAEREDRGKDDGDDKEERAERATTVRRKAKGKKARSSADDDEGEGGGSPFPALSLEIGPRFMSRDLSYSRNFAPLLLPFSVKFRTAMGFSALWFPGAHTSTGFISNVGIVVNGEYATTFISRTPPPDSLAYPTKSSDYFGGVRVRFPLSFIEPSVTAGYGKHAFVITSGPQSPRNGVNVPDVSYSYLRLAGDVRVALPASLTLLAGAGYRNVTSAGSAGYQIQSMEYFPKAKVMAFDLMGALAYRAHPLLEVRVGADLRRYIYTTNAVTTDPVPLAGFADQYISFWAHLALVVDGMGGGHKRGDAPPAGAVSADDEE